MTTAGQPPQSAASRERVSDPSGPGNKAIATQLLAGLAARGERATEERARRALEGEGVDLAGASAWLPADATRALFVAADLDPARARALGHALVVPEAIGLGLYRLGLGTPEKAYRRVQAMLPRDAATSCWEVEEIDAQTARLGYAPHRIDGATRMESSLCAMRIGMLEAVPGLYGLLPATVRESQCVARGADACRYEVAWSTTSRTGLRVGAGVGAALGTALALAPGLFGSIGLGALASVVGGLFFFCAALAGAAVDLRRQLAAVAGARRGHLALFDQVDVALAEKLDALARTEAKLETPAIATPVRRPVAGASDDRPATDGPIGVDRAQEEREREIETAARQIHAAAGDVECWFEAAARVEGARGIADERGLVRDIREWAARIGRFGGEDATAHREHVDPERLVARAIAAARPGLAPAAKITLDAAERLPPLPCEPVQIEHVVIQLLRNAVEASMDLCDAPEVVVRLRPAAIGLEICVEDRGVGIESAEIDEVFDPFFGDGPAGASGGFGLPVCLRIVEGHGGELRFDNGSGVGTRVSVLLPVEGRVADDADEGERA